MTFAILMTVLSIGLARGFLHALDPDHVMTIAALSSRQGTAQPGKPMQYALLWSLGHGAMIIAAASIVIVTGQHLPAAISASAETIVGVILITTGASVLWSLYNQQDGRQPSHRVASPGLITGSNQAAPLMIGFVHGIAGSASLMALVPIALMEPGSRLAFVFVFCAGVLFAMLVFSLFYSRLQQLLLRASKGYVEALQVAVGVGSIGLGAFWLIWG